MSLKTLTPIELPRVTTAQRDALPSDQRGTGSLVFNTTTGQPEVNKGTAGTPLWQPAGGGAPDVPTKLYQGQPGTSAATVYTVPNGKQARIETARIVNNDTVARTITLYDGGTAAGNTILPDTEIAAGDWIEVDLSGVCLPQAGTIAAKASAGAVVTLTLYGSEEDVGSKAYKKLAQVTLSAAMALVYTNVARTLISHIRAANTGAVARGLGLADGGTAAVNTIQQAAAPSSSIPAGGVMEIQSYLGGASGGTLNAMATAASEVVLTVYGIEG